MKLYSWNINGIRAVLRKGAIQDFLQQEDPDVVFLQEIKAKPEQIEHDFGEYSTFWHSAERPGYSGTGIVSKTEPISVTNGLPEDLIEKYHLNDEYGDSATEGRVISAEFDDYFVVGVYTPNAKDDLTRIPLRHKAWDPAFLEYMKQLEKTKPVIVCGDLNVAHTEDDLARPKENRGKKGFTDEEREGFQNFIDNGYVDSFRHFTQGNGHYTWWSHWGKARERNVGWRIDYFLVSDKLKPRLKSAAIHAEVMGSDHCPISIELSDE